MYDLLGLVKFLRIRRNQCKGIQSEKDTHS